MKNVLVLGASGYIGSYLVPALQQAGFSVSASARNPALLEARGWQGVRLVAADALSPDSLKTAFSGIDLVFHLVHSMSAGANFEALDNQAADNVAAAAAAAGVSRIIYLGGLQPTSGPISRHLSSRRETGDHLRQGPTPVTEVRAGIIVGPGSAAFEVIRDLVNHLPIMITPRWVRSRTQPIALDDLIDYLVAIAQEPATAGQILDVSGPETLRYEELIKQYAQVVNRPCWIVRVPVLTPRLSSYWLDLVTSVPAKVARPLIDGLREDLLANDALARPLLKRPLLTYRQAVINALQRERSAPVPARWTEGALAYRANRADVSFYSKGDRTVTPAPVAAKYVWREVQTIGGARGWYYANWLWQARGMLDRLVGGPGLRPGRRHPVDLRVGDALDFWRVTAIEPGRSLTLVAEMKLPGAAVLQFEVEPEDLTHCRLITTAKFSPAGWPGMLYWYAVSPFHGPIFTNMPKAMVRRAERLAEHVARQRRLAGKGTPPPA